jgi:hypothetical protein
MLTYPYRSLAGSLMYLDMGTRPDLVFAVEQLTQFQTDPGKPRWDADQKVILRHEIPGFGAGRPKFPFETYPLRHRKTI